MHVDAYRLRDALELDDLDIDFAGSVVVAEWGAGLLDGVADSWLEIVIARPTGAGEQFDPAEAPEEPRVVTIAGHGSRWDGVEL